MAVISHVVCVLFVLNSLAFTQNAKAAKILSIIPFPMKSHDIVYKPLLLELARRGHEVTTITAYPLGKTVKNYKEIVFKTRGMDILKSFDFYEIKRLDKIWNKGIFELLPFWDLVSLVLEDVFTHPEVDTMINSYSEKDRFDLVICEGYFGSEALFAFGELYRAPTIAVGTFGNTVYMNQYIGNPLAAAYYPNFLLPYTDKMTFVERLHNFAMNSFILVCNQLFHVPDQERLINKYFSKAFASRPIPTLHEMTSEVSLIFLNIHSILGYTRPNLPNIIDVGGLHIEEQKNDTIDEELQRKMDNAKAGIIYFSLGSNVNIKNMPPQYKQAFIEAFSKLPQTIFWKSDYELPGMMENVEVRSWFPQQQILAHKNCVAFITHGGILSLEEAAFNAVPIIGIPFFGDQTMNLKLVNNMNFGIELEYENITEKAVSWAVDQIVHNKVYKENAKKVSSIFRDGFGTPLERAVYWVEYVIRHNGAKHLRSGARLLPWYKLLLLDVLVAILAAIIVPLFILYLTLRTIYRYLIRKSKKRVSKEKKKS